MINNFVNIHSLNSSNRISRPDLKKNNQINKQNNSSGKISFKGAYNSIFIDEMDFRNDQGFSLYFDWRFKLPLMKQINILKKAHQLREEAEKFNRKNDLMSSYKAKNKLVRALLYFDRALGSDHIITINTAQALAKQYQEMGDNKFSYNYFLPKAQYLYETIADQCEQLKTEGKIKPYSELIRDIEMELKTTKIIKRELDKLPAPNLFGIIFSRKSK